ncbi:MAG: 30S ribosomal protein S16 [Waddliaceae bacterium]|nr:30S ribosomal protein S16 [Waddliaceae bacterium]
MTLKIRLRKQGRTNRPFYRLVLVPDVTKRDGAYVESLGWYNPFAEGDQRLLVNANRVQHWLNNGAQMTEKAKHLVAEAAPEVMKTYTQQACAKKMKEAAKRRERRKKAKAA